MPVEDMVPRAWMPALAPVPTVTVCTQLSHQPTSFIGNRESNGSQSQIAKLPINHSQVLPSCLAIGASFFLKVLFIDDHRSRYGQHHFLISLKFPFVRGYVKEKEVEVKLPERVFCHDCKYCYDFGTY